MSGRGTLLDAVTSLTLPLWPVYLWALLGLAAAVPFALKRKEKPDPAFSAGRLALAVILSAGGVFLVSGTWIAYLLDWRIYPKSLSVFRLLFSAQVQADLLAVADAGLLAAVIVFKALDRKTWGDLGVRAPETRGWALVFLVLGALLLDGISDFAFSRALMAGAVPFAETERFVETLRDFPPAARILHVAEAVVLVPVAEELFFRGALLRIFSGRMNTALAVVLQAAVFGCAHNSLAALGPVFVFGLITGVLARKTGSVLPGMAVHGIKNALAVIGPLVLAALS